MVTMWSTSTDHKRDDRIHYEDVGKHGEARDHRGHRQGSSMTRAIDGRGKATSLHSLPTDSRPSMPLTKQAGSTGPERIRPPSPLLSEGRRVDDALGPSDLPSPGRGMEAVMMTAEPRFVAVALCRPPIVTMTPYACGIIAKNFGCTTLIPEKTFPKCSGYFHG